MSGGGGGGLDDVDFECDETRELEEWVVVVEDYSSICHCDGVMAMRTP